MIDSATSTKTGLLDGSLMSVLEFQATGFLVVLGTLTVLFILTALMGKLFTKRDKSLTAAPKSKNRDQAKSSSQNVSEKSEIPPHHLAVIAAAAEVAMQGQPHRVIKIEGPASSDWSMRGRFRHHNSHKIR